MHSTCNFGSFLFGLFRGPTHDVCRCQFSTTAFSVLPSTFECGSLLGNLLNLFDGFFTSLPNEELFQLLRCLELVNESDNVSGTCGIWHLLDEFHNLWVFFHEWLNEF